MKQLIFCIKMLRRDFKCGELKLLIIAVLTAVICVTSINFFIDGVKRSLEHKSGELLGGDRVIQTASSITDTVLPVAKQYDLQITETISFYSMLFSGGENALTAMRAVEYNYPLLG